MLEPSIRVSSRIFLGLVQSMDYDRSDIPTVYDEARTLTPQRLRQWMDLLSAHIERETISLILDLGCGTGRFSEPLARHFSARVVAIDPSQKMLDQARRKLGSASITWLRASAEAPPLHDGSVDLVFMSMVYHHFIDRALVVKECLRMLRDGGYVCIRNSTREADFLEKHFFPAILPMIDSELPDRKDIDRAFVTGIFRCGSRDCAASCSAELVELRSKILTPCSSRWDAMGAPREIATPGNMGTIRRNLTYFEQW